MNESKLTHECIDALKSLGFCWGEIVQGRDYQLLVARHAPPIAAAEFRLVIAKWDDSICWPHISYIQFAGGRRQLFEHMMSNTLPCKPIYYTKGGNPAAIKTIGQMAIAHVSKLATS